MQIRRKQCCVALNLSFPFSLHSDTVHLSSSKHSYGVILLVILFLVAVCRIFGMETMVALPLGVLM